MCKTFYQTLEVIQKVEINIFTCFAQKEPVARAEGEDADT